MVAKREEANLTIGHFGRLSQLSRKALRVYDERGLLVPVYVDPDSGYRYYSRSQVTLARRIRLLRLLEMPLDKVAVILNAWDDDPLTAQRWIQAHVTAVEKQVATIRTAAKLLTQEFVLDQENDMSFEFQEREIGTQTAVAIRRNITVPEYHQWMMPALKQMWGHIEAQGGRPTGDPVALYYGPVNEEDDGPVEICIPFEGAVSPQGEIKIRELPAHKAIHIRTYGEYNEYPKILEMWNALARHIDQNKLEPNWEGDMTTYEVWHEDESMTIGWPVYDFLADVKADRENA